MLKKYLATIIQLPAEKTESYVNTWNQFIQVINNLTLINKRGHKDMIVIKEEFSGKIIYKINIFYIKVETF